MCDQVKARKRTRYFRGPYLVISTGSWIPCPRGSPVSVDIRRPVPMHWDRPSRASLLHTSDRLSPRSSSILARSSTPSPTGSHTSDLYFGNETPKPTIILGICAMDVKARSKAMREILTRLVDRARGTIEVKVFGDKVILDEGEPRSV